MTRDLEPPVDQTEVDNAEITEPIDEGWAEIARGAANDFLETLRDVVGADLLDHEIGTPYIELDSNERFLRVSVAALLDSGLSDAQHSALINGFAERTVSEASGWMFDGGGTVQLNDGTWAVSATVWRIL